MYLLIVKSNDLEYSHYRKTISFFPATRTLYRDITSAVRDGQSRPAKKATAAVRDKYCFATRLGSLARQRGVGRRKRPGGSAKIGKEREARQSGKERTSGQKKKEKREIEGAE